MPVFPHAGEAIYYEAAGAGPPLLLLHSLGCGAPAWRPQLAAFSPGYTVIAPDLRGHGRTTHRSGAGMEAMADDMAALLIHLELGPAAAAVGVSMGGVVAQLLAARHPALVQALVAADTFCRLPPAEAQRRIDQRETELAQVTDMAAHARRRADTGLLPTCPPAGRDCFVEAAAAMTVAGYLAATHALYRVDNRPLLPRLRLPTLVLVGEHDPSTPLPMAQEIAALIPGARLEVLPGAGHLSNLDNAPAFNGALSGFLFNVHR